jgi:hypothetical protein
MFCFKGTVSQDFLLQVFFHESFSHKPLKLSLGSFQMFTKISEDIRKSRFTTCINDTGGIAVVVVTGGKFSEVSDREISSAI